jgi:hypothetical protein
VEDCEFEDDHASKNGGIFHMNGGKLIINRTEMNNGYAGYSGAMHFDNVCVDLWLFCYVCLIVCLSF